MQRVNSTAFVNQVLRGIVEGKSTLNAYFVTYRGVRGYPNGRVDTRQPGLIIEVRGGDLQNYNMDSGMKLMLGLITNDKEMSSAADDELRSEAVRALHKVESEVQTPVPDHENLLFVIYVGQMAFNEAVNHANSIRQAHPKADIVLVTCECDLDSKMRKLEREGFPTLVETSQCGGKDDMKYILESLMQLWPNGPTYEH